MESCREPYGPGMVQPKGGSRVQIIGEYCARLWTQRAPNTMARKNSFMFDTLAVSVPYTVDVSVHSGVSVLNTVSTTYHPDAVITSREDAPESEKYRRNCRDSGTRTRRRGNLSCASRGAAGEKWASGGSICAQTCADALDSKVRVEVVPTMRQFSNALGARFAERIARRLNGPCEVVLDVAAAGITTSRTGPIAAFEAIGESMPPGVARTKATLGNGLTGGARFAGEDAGRVVGRSAGAESDDVFADVSRATLKSYPNLLLRASSRCRWVWTSNVFILAKERQADWRVAGEYLDRHEIDQRFPDRTPGQLVLLFAGHNFGLSGPAGVCCWRCAKLCDAGLNATALVVGKISGNNRAFRTMAGLMGLEFAEIRFLGTVPDAEMGRLYRSCDALVHPTYSDHCSLVVLEAFACGLPVGPRARMARQN